MILKKLIKFSFDGNNVKTFPAGEHAALPKEVIVFAQALGAIEEPEPEPEPKRETPQ